MKRVWQNIADNLTGFLTSWCSATLAALFYLPWRKAATLSAIMLAVLVISFWLNTIVQRRRYRTRAGEAVVLQQCRAVVVTVGLSPEVIVFILSRMKPEFIGFIYTARSEEVYKQVVRHLGLVDGTFEPVLVDPESFQHVMDNTRHVFRWLIDTKGVRVEDITLDVTGALTAMSVGAYAAAREFGVRSQCLIPEFDADRKPKGVRKVLTLGQRA